jgi:hypothetical protein
MIVTFMLLDLNKIPMLGSNINLWNCLMYRSENRHKKHYFLLYDDVNQHYDCITNIKAFLGCKCFCFKCLRSFTNNETYDNHTCDSTKPKTNIRLAGEMQKN